MLTPHLENQMSVPFFRQIFLLFKTAHSLPLRTLQSCFQDLLGHLGLVVYPFFKKKVSVLILFSA